jgi:hypothetical protein
VFHFLDSCVFIRIDDSIDLGNKYRYIQDYPQVIVYHKTPKYKGGGINIIPPIVLSYKFNDRYIVAKSQEVDEMTGNKKAIPIHYWIVDKTTDGAPVEPIDSINFYQRLKDLKINLHL